MIRYTLRCDADHQFDSWFQSAAAFDSLQGAGHINCAVCGSSAVTKALMAPQISRSAAPAPDADSNVDPALQALRRAVEEQSDYVGMSFAAEARRMHDGDAPTRPIHGEAKLEDARALLEDGIPVLPLPFIPARKTN
ncbi:Protein containing DUF1178 [Ketogulonicigenium robustum]|uniref:Protein containing DUF1178 n=1 Tax=Ketogulonicigenium robustum TaxID=92947 RepID=A0A1W6NWN4_9RHOB|nr:DUF1178 family protein [Ketogulonicigenium robustum]ARO13553.1 Protein containing DUF1178 [Ketogulonicigenium robustum]